MAPATPAASTSRQLPPWKESWKHIPEIPVHTGHSVHPVGPPRQAERSERRTSTSNPHVLCRAGNYTQLSKSPLEPDGRGSFCMIAGPITDCLQCAELPFCLRTSG